MEVGSHYQASDQNLQFFVIIALSLTHYILKNIPAMFLKLHVPHLYATERWKLRKRYCFHWLYCKKKAVNGNFFS